MAGFFIVNASDAYWDDRCNVGFDPKIGRLLRGVHAFADDLPADEAGRWALVRGLVVLWMRNNRLSYNEESDVYGLRLFDESGQLVGRYSFCVEIKYEFSNEESD